MNHENDIPEVMQIAIDKTCEKIEEAMRPTNVINFRLAKLFRTVAPWQTPEEAKANLHAIRQTLNHAIIDRMNGVPANRGNEETNADCGNPNVLPDVSREG